MKTAILVDGGYYRKVALKAFGLKSPKESAHELYTYCFNHLNEKYAKKNHAKHELYRIFYYDCPPLDSNIYNPITKKQEFFGKSETGKWMNEFLKELTKKRKVALRLGEIMALKWTDIKDGIAIIDKQFSRVEKSKFDIKCTKTDTSIREVPLPDIASKIIEKFRDGTGYIFSDDGEKPFDRKRVQRRYKQICKENNIESTFHSLRHTFATNMVSANVNLAVLKDLLGHKSLDTTMIYSHITQKAKQESVDKIADKLDIKAANIL